MKEYLDLIEQTLDAVIPQERPDVLFSAKDCDGVTGADPGSALSVFLGKIFAEVCGEHLSLYVGRGVSLCFPLNPCFATNHLFHLKR